MTSFIQESKSRQDKDKIPSGFIVTGANIASQDLLFEQLSENLQEEADAKVVRLRSADASNLKAALKKIINDVTARAAEGDDDVEIAVGRDVSQEILMAILFTDLFQGRRYLNYDLEAMYSYLKASPKSHIIICFQDSEAFESKLLTDLILLFR